MRPHGRLVHDLLKPLGTEVRVLAVINGRTAGVPPQVNIV